MKTKADLKHRRMIFTADARLGIKRIPSGKFTADQIGGKSDVVTLEGYAITWNTLSSDRGGYRVRLASGSAKFTPVVHALFHHDYALILGSTDNNTLRLTSDNVGVKVEIDLPNTHCAADTIELVEKKYVSGMSFSMLFDPPIESTTTTEGGLEIVDVSSFYCDEVTVTAIPSFDSTSIATQEDEPDDEDPASVQPDPAFARIEQSIRLDQLTLALKKI